MSNDTPPKIEKGTPEEFAALSRWMDQMHQRIQGGLSLTEDVNQRRVQVVFRGAGVETPVEHGLNRVPKGFMVAENKTAGAVISETARERTSNRIYLQSSVGGAKVTLLFY